MKKLYKKHPNKIHALFITGLLIYGTLLVLNPGVLLISLLVALSVIMWSLLR